MALTSPQHNRAPDCAVDTQESAPQPIMIGSIKHRVQDVSGVHACELPVTSLTLAMISATLWPQRRRK